MVRSGWIVTAVVLVLAAGCMAAEAVMPAKPETLRFAVIGDRNGGNIPGLWPKAIEEINLLKPELVMSVGDFIGGYTEDKAEIDKQWKGFLAENSKLEAPFYITPGNHDETNAVERAEYLKRFGKDGRSYYSFDYRGCHFVVLDSTIFEKQGVDPNQLSWFKADMEKAKDSRHVFVFYHHPADEKSAVWKQIAPLLISGKTTVFNGHTHSMTYAKQNGIDTYTLAATAASTGNRGPDFGNIEMFAFVTVDGGEPTVAAITVGHVRNAKSVDRGLVAAVSRLASQLEIVQAPTAAGREVAITQANPLDKTVSIAVSVEGIGYAARPQRTDIAVKPRQSSSATIQVEGYPSESFSTSVPSPRVKCTYTLTDSEGKNNTMNIEEVMGRFSVVKKVTGITVDGKLDDWIGVKPEALPSFGHLLTEGTGRSDDVDFSAEIRLACDETNLYVAISVADDNLRTGLTPATENDGLGFYWSVPKVWRSSEPNLPASGGVRLIPVAGQVEPIWTISKKLTKPAHFRAVAAKTDTGYICELAMPLADIGAKSPVKAGELLNWRLQFRDIDKSGGEARVFTVGGTTEPKESPESWITGVIK